jgi:hypothetical protein
LIAIAAATCAASAIAANPTLQNAGQRRHRAPARHLQRSTPTSHGRAGAKAPCCALIDGGEHWVNVSVPDAKGALDFRDVEGFDANHRRSC